MMVVNVTINGTVSSRIGQKPCIWLNARTTARLAQASAISSTRCRPVRSATRATPGVMNRRRKKGAAITVLISAAVNPRPSSQTGI